jgi:DNA-binding NtrC family response regulator
MQLPPRDAQTETAPTLQSARRPLLTLRLLYSGEAGVAARPAELLTPGALPIGRAVEPGLCLPADRRASRHHATLEVASDETAVTVRDHGSKNGTFVNGARITQAALGDGDLLRIGDSFFILRHEPIASAVDTPIEGVVGISPAMRALRRELRLLAPTASTVLLLGETGTGKEVCAQALHRLSERRAQPLVVLDGGAVPRTLIESELFGHEAGAFTGAQRGRPGLFEQASGGTLFIDELGELPLELQPMLLRALEHGTIRRVGGAAPLRVEVRVIAATNRDLQREVASQHFRADLYARLAEITLRLPPLRERREDILPLLLHALGAPAPRLSPELVESLLLYPWPFNVREVIKLATELQTRGRGAPVLELELIAHRLQTQPAAATSRQPTAAAPPLPASAVQPSPVAATRLTQPSREELLRLLQSATGGISELARHFGCSRKQIYRWLDLHGLRGERAPAGDHDPSAQ